MLGLKKIEKLRKNKSFQALYRGGKSFANRQLVLYVLPNHRPGRRVGFAAGKKLGGAVTRNRIKRMLREAYRLSQHRLINGIDIIIVGRQTIISEKTATVAAARVAGPDGRGVSPPACATQRRAGRRKCQC